MATPDRKAVAGPSPQRPKMDRSQLPPMSPARVVSSAQKGATSRPHSNSLQWAASPFSHLDVLSPGSTMSSFGLSSPDRYPFAGDLLNGRDMSPGTPLTMTRPGATEDFPASPMFSPSLFSPYDTAVPRHRNPGDGTKMSLENDFHNSKMEELPFASLQNSSAAQLFRHFDSTILGLKGLKSGLIGDYDHEDSSLDVSSSSSQHSTSTSSASGADRKFEHRTPLTRTNSIPGVQNRTSDPSTSFFSPPNAPRPKSSPTGMSPAMSENLTPSHCNCKRSKCLKLYCECFAALRYCSSCNCVECNNRPETEHSRQTAIQITRERNAGAFETKVSMDQGHSTGCHCKKSQCLKKYCECYEGDAFCGENCKCISCLNYEGSEGLESARSVKMRKSGGSAAVNMKDRKNSPTSIASVPMASASLQMIGMKRHPMPGFSSPSTDGGGESSATDDTPLKKRRTFSIKTEPLYSFFGSTVEPTSKLVALRVLEYLDGKSLYSMSLANQLWSKTAMDDALWEVNDN